MILKNKKELSIEKNKIIALAIFFCLMIIVLSQLNLKKSETIQRQSKDLKTTISNNNVFLGDSITALYDVEKYFPNIHVVNSGVHANTTDDILIGIEERVLQYNPSKVFILIGTNDIQLNNTDEHILNRLEMMTIIIKKHRPNAKIYIQSIYPVSTRKDLYDKINLMSVGNRNNERIVSLNKKIRKLCQKNNIQYIDIFSKLVDEEGSINIKYTKEGLHLTDEAYEVVTEEITKYLEPEEQELLKKENS